MAIPFRSMTGRWLDLERPQPCDIDVRDIASGLSKVCRFAGQIETFYSVAQHAMFVSELVAPALQFRALNHDDSEAYLGDVSHHLKHSTHLAGYRVLEERMEDVILEALGLSKPTPEEHQAIKDADAYAVLFEHATLRLRLPLTPDLIAELLGDGFIRGVDLETLVAIGDRVDQTASWIRPHRKREVRAVEEEFLMRWQILKDGRYGA